MSSKRAETKAEAIARKDEEDQEDEMDHDDDNEDDKEDGEEELIDVDFDFFDPKEIDFHGLKSLIKQTVANDAEQFDISGLADLIIARPHLGSVVKVDDSTDPYAVMTVLSLIPDSKTKKLPAPITTIKEYILAKSAKSNKEHHTGFQILLNTKACGLLVNERLINMPPQIVVPMLKMLDEELDWSVEEKKEKEFEYLCYISKTYQEVEPLTEEDADNEGPSRKKKKKGANSKIVLNFQVEDEVFEKHAEYHFDFQFTNQTDHSELQQTAGIKTSRRLYLIKRSNLKAVHNDMKELLN
ncbi:Mss4p nuclear export [Podochytrium sp. JEL0797]|nr:Mss4p nuclear export [Podochytrium sp. JEL0797]